MVHVTYFIFNIMYPMLLVSNLISVPYRKTRVPVTRVANPGGFYPDPDPTFEQNKKVFDNILKPGQTSFR